MKKVLIIASELDERLTLVKHLREHYKLETLSMIPNGFNQVRSMNLDGVIISVERQEKMLQFCRKIESSSQQIWICLYDKNRKMKEVENLVSGYKISGYWSGNSSKEFLRFIQQCSLGNTIIHKRESRLTKFLAIMTNRKRKT